MRFQNPHKRALLIAGVDRAVRPQGRHLAQLPHLHDRPLDAHARDAALPEAAAARVRLPGRRVPRGQHHHQALLHRGVLRALLGLGHRVHAPLREGHGQGKPGLGRPDGCRAPLVCGLLEQAGPAGQGPLLRKNNDHSVSLQRKFYVPTASVQRVHYQEEHCCLPHQKECK